MSLYRQYRPQTFADVAGQSPIVDTLIQAVAQNNIAHAYLFAGIRGTGKTSIARILAKEILTRDMDDAVLKEGILKSIQEGNLVDLIEIDAASNRGIDDIRSLLEKIQFTPVVAGAKVYIIDEVHMLTKEAFNALLKTLEEPPAYAYFILATTELHKIPATIQSRCQRFLFRQIREEDTIRRLRLIADAESINIEDNALQAIAHTSGGSMRDAISLLDQLRSLSANITIADVKEHTGESGHEYMEQILHAVQNGDRQTIITLVRTMEEAAVPFENVTRLLLEEVRSRMHAAIDKQQDATPFVTMLDTLMSCIRSLRIAPVPGLVLESSLLMLAGKSEEMSNNESQKFENVKPANLQPATPKEPQTSNEQPATRNVAPDLRLVRRSLSEVGSPIADHPSIDLSALRAAWPQIVEKVEPAFVRMSLKNGRLHAVDGNHVIVAFGSSFHRDKASSPEGARTVDEAMEALFHIPLKLQCVLDTDLQSGPVIAHEEVVNLAEAAADIF